MLTFALDAAALLITALASYGMARIAARSEIAALHQRLDVLDKGNLRANLVADSAVTTAQRAEEKAIEARDLAENACAPRVSVTGDVASGEE